MKQITEMNINELEMLFNLINNEGINLSGIVKFKDSFSEADLKFYEPEEFNFLTGAYIDTFEDYFFDNLLVFDNELLLKGN